MENSVLSLFFDEVKTCLPAQKGTIDTIPINYTRTFPKCLKRNKNRPFPSARKFHQTTFSPTLSSATPIPVRAGRYCVLHNLSGSSQGQVKPFVTQHNKQ